jgi:cysteinyl-tRNA synthetase
MSLQVYSTLTRKKEPFHKRPGEPVTMYVCGPTVYSFAHIGNARPNVVFDVLARLLRRSYTLLYARNVTDVDDKINAAAVAEGIPIGVLTRRYFDAFRQDMQVLGVEPPDAEPKVTEHIPDIIAFIERLLETGHAYVAEAHVLFDVASFEPYGRLSGRATEDMLAGARVEVAPYKRNPADFVLWKPSAADGVGWPSPWGHGRPGWHIECSTMVATELGTTIDIHGGGQDLVFPHHENEIAQSTCAHAGATYARYWVHNGLIHVDSEKMSKSIGNVLLLRDLLREAPGEAVRLALLGTHYRQPLDWTAQVLPDAEQKLDRLYGALRAAGVGHHATGAPNEEPAGVVAALEDDLNTPQALAELFALARAANRAEDQQRRREIALALRAGAGLLGLLQSDPEEWFLRGGHDGLQFADGEIEALIERRDALRRARDFAAADRIRDELASRGVVLEDGAGGSRWRRSR